jgi:hypothetical protein
MATFKVGQRVRIKTTASCMPEDRDALGKEATILSSGYHGYEWELDLPGREWRHVGANSIALEPLTPPQSESDQWAASKLDQLKKLVREPQPLDTKQLEEIHGGQAK